MTDTQLSQAQTQPLIDFAPMLSTLWQRRLLIAGSTAAMLAAASGYLAVAKPIYTAQSVVLVDPIKPQTTETDNVLPGIGSDSAAIASQVAVIGSRELLSRVFDSEGIVDDPEFNQAGLIGGLLGTQPTRAMVFDKFAKNVAVEREGLTYILDIGFKSSDPEKAARIANAIVTEYISGQIARKAGANAEVSALLDGRISELELELTRAERAVQAFRSQHGLYAAGGGSTQLQARIDQLETQLASARDQAREAQTRADQALAAGTDAGALLDLSDVLDSPAAEGLREQFNQRTLELSSSQSILGPQHPTVRRLESELQRVRRLMAQEAGRITESLVSASKIAQGVVARTEADLESLRAESNRANVNEVELRQLERNADAARVVLEAFKKRATETSQFETLQFSDARVVTAATAPLQPTWPKTWLVLAVAAALGLMLGCWIALVRGAPSQVAIKSSGTVGQRLKTRPVVPPPQPAAVTTPGAAIAAQSAAYRASRPSPQETVKIRASAPPKPSTAQSFRNTKAATADVQAARAELRRKKGFAELN